MLFIAAVLIVFMLSTLTVVVRRGLNEIIRGPESLDERLARMERPPETPETPRRPFP